MSWGEGLLRRNTTDESVGADNAQESIHPLVCVSYLKEVWIQIVTIMPDFDPSCTAVGRGINGLIRITKITYEKTRQVGQSHIFTSPTVLPPSWYPDSSNPSSCGGLRPQSTFMLPHILHSTTRAAAAVHNPTQALRNVLQLQSSGPSSGSNSSRGNGPSSGGPKFNTGSRFHTNYNVCSSS